MVSAAELRAVRISGFLLSLLGSMTRNMGLSASVPVGRNESWNTPVIYTFNTAK
jgi:hypothetical protein